MNQKMCFSLCTLNHSSPVYKEYLTGSTGSKNAVQNDSHCVWEGKAFFPLTILSAFTSRISQYLALENKWIHTTPIIAVNGALHHVFQPPFSCHCLCMEQVPHKHKQRQYIVLLLNFSL